MCGYLIGEEHLLGCFHELIVLLRFLGQTLLQCSKSTCNESNCPYGALHGNHPEVCMAGNARGFTLRMSSVSKSW